MGKTERKDTYLFTNEGEGKERARARERASERDRYCIDKNQITYLLAYYAYLSYTELI